MSNNGQWGTHVLDVVASFIVENIKDWTRLRIVCILWKKSSQMWLKHINSVIVCKKKEHVPCIAKLVGIQKLSLWNKDWLNDMLTVTSLQQLSLTNQPEPITQFQQISCFVRLNSLNLSGCTLRTDEKDDGLEALSVLTNLDHLILHRTVLGWYRRLSFLTHLKFLDIRACKGVGEIACLTPLTQLQTLLLDKFQGSIQPISALTNLECLWLTDTAITNACLQYLKPLSVLQQLLLDGTQITDEGLSTLGEMVSLRDMHLWDCPVTFDAVQKNFSKLKLTTLVINRISFLDFQDKKIPGLGLMSSLTRLYLAHANLTNAGLNMLTCLPLKLPNLQNLNLANNRSITNECLQGLTVLSQLRFLDLQHSRITDDCMKQLCNALRLLCELQLSDCRALTDETCTYLTQLPQLKILGIQSTNISNGGLLSLTSITTLRFLYVERCSKITERGVRMFMDSAHPDVYCCHYKIKAILQLTQWQ